MKVKDFLKLCGEKDALEVALYECDERDEVIGYPNTFLTDDRFSEAIEGEIASWDYDDNYGEQILCIYYFKN